MTGTQRDAVRIRRKQTAICGTFAVAGLVALLFGAFSVNDAVTAFRDQDAYTAARPCPAGAAEGADCLRVVSATVTGVSTTATKHPSSELDLVADGTAFASGFAGVPALVTAAYPGEPVTVTEWRGRATAVSGTGGVEATGDAPSERFRSALRGAQALLGFAMLCLPLTGAVHVKLRRGRYRWTETGLFAFTATTLCGTVSLVSAASLDERISVALNTAITLGLLVAAIAGAALVGVKFGIHADPAQDRGR